MAGTEMLDDASEFEYELESAEGALWTGSRLFVGIGVMTWAGVAFAYFYLRAVDQQGQWDPRHVHPSNPLGALIFGSAVLGTLLVTFARRRLLDGFSFEFQVAGWLGVALAVIAAGFQIWELTRLPFFPGLGGYTSVFIGFAPLNVAMLLGGAYWLESLVARTLRLQGQLGVDMGLGTSELPEARLLRASLEGCQSYWWFMSVASLLFWVLFYLL